MPPYVNQDRSGLTVDMLRALEKISDYRFDIEIMTYARIKQQLENRQLDLGGLTPKDRESASFYQYAQELDWHYQTTGDLVFFNQSFTQIKNIAPKRIGTTLGNADFLAQQLDLPASYFIEVATPYQLTDMFINRRIDVMFFERISMMYLLQNYPILGAYYHTIADIPISLAVPKTAKGNQLKTELDKLLKVISVERIYSCAEAFRSLPNHGVVPLIK